MRVTKDGVCSSGSDICGTCSKDDTECVFKKALSNYHDGGEIPIRIIVMDCPEYRMVDEREIDMDCFTNEIRTQFNPHATLNSNVTVRINTEVTDSGT